MWLRHPNTPAFLTAAIGCFSEDDPAAPRPAWATKIHGLMTAITPLHSGPVRFEGGLTEVGPGLQAWLQPNGLLGESNAGLVVGDGASLLVDTLWDPRLTRRMLAAMAPLIEKAPIETLVNTHSDGDHWWGNQEVPTTEIIATESARAVMEAESPAEMKRFGALAAALRFAGSMPFPYPRRDAIAAIAAYVSEALAPFSFDELRLAPPTRTFSGQLELDVGGRKVTLIEVGPAHTPGDLIVWVPDAKVAFAADILFIGVTPIMWAGPLEGWIAALERLLGLDAEWFVPGHGPVCGPRRGGAPDRLLALARRGRRTAPQCQRLARRSGARAGPRRGDRGAGIRRLAGPRAGAGERGHDRCPPSRRRQVTRATRADRRVLSDGAAGARL
jgi:cyclase